MGKVSKGSIYFENHTYSYSISIKYMQQPLSDCLQIDLKTDTFTKIIEHFSRKIAVVNELVE